MNPTIDITKLKLSELLRLSVRDAQAAEAAGCILDMGTWVEPKEDGCHVCMAGAVLLQTLGLDRDEYAEPDNEDDDIIDAEISSAMHAINYMRVGHFLSAQEEISGMYGAVSAETRTCLEAEQTVLAAYDSYISRAPWETYLEAADILEAGGL